jgi:predicted outer membrane repeat protein
VSAALTIDGVNPAYSGTTATTAGLYKGADTTAIDVSAEAGGGLLEKAINWLKTHAVENTTYSILLDADETLNPTVLSPAQLNNANNLPIILKGLGIAERTIQLGATNGSLFTVNQGITLILDGSITLKGRGNNTDSLVSVASSTLAMKGSSKITGNKASSGGGVYVYGFYSGTFTMSDSATVSGNTASSGGGVYVGNGGFTMSGSVTVSGNSASGGGGGVYVYQGAFTMSDSATVSGNTASSGGGVYVYMLDYDTFTMSDSATVSGNTVNSTSSIYGGAFTMSGNATVSSNTANATTSIYGGGVYVSGLIRRSNTFFTMSGNATVSGNTASASSASATSAYGGGVYVGQYYTTFTKTGGVIYSAGAGANSNTVKIGGVERIQRGTAIYADIDHWRDTTVNAALSKNGSTYTRQWTD